MDIVMRDLRTGWPSALVQALQVTLSQAGFAVGGGEDSKLQDGVLQILIHPRP